MPERIMVHQFTMVRPATGISGRIRASGRLLCTIDPKILPEARILPVRAEIIEQMSRR